MTNKSKKSKGLKKPIKWIGFILLAIFLYFAAIFFVPNIFPNNKEKAFLCIPDSSTFKDVTGLLSKNAKVLNMTSFTQVAGFLYYGTKIRSGRYALKSGMYNFQLNRSLSSTS